MGEAARRRRSSGTISAERQERIASVGESVDAVTEANRRWFERRPHRSHRIRIMARSEGVQMAAVLDLDACPAPRFGLEWATVVFQLQPGARMRRHVQVERGSDLDGASEETCRAIYDAVRTDETDRIEASVAQAFSEAGK